MAAPDQASRPEGKAENAFAAYGTAQLGGTVSGGVEMMVERRGGVSPGHSLYLMP